VVYEYKIDMRERERERERERGGGSGGSMGSHKLQSLYSFIYYHYTVSC